MIVWNDKKSTYFIEGRKPCRVGDEISDSVLEKMGKKRVKAWIKDGVLLEKEPEKTERDIRFEEAKALGLKPHFKTGIDKLNVMIQDHEDLQELKKEALGLGIDPRDDVRFDELYDLVEEKKAEKADNESDK